MNDQKPDPTDRAPQDRKSPKDDQAKGGASSTGQATEGFTGESDSGEYLQSTDGDQAFADQGQGAPASSDSSGEVDITTEKSQGRDSDVEGSSL